MAQESNLGIVYPTLDQIGLKTCTDKNSKFHNYLEFYERYFAPCRQNRFTLIEVGVYEGASIKMWEEYFPNAKIIGLDINPQVAGGGRACGSSN